VYEEYLASRECHEILRGRLLVNNTSKFIYHFHLNNQCFVINVDHTVLQMKNVKNTQTYCILFTSNFYFVLQSLI
jgi:hypothetical protein